MAEIRQQVADEGEISEQACEQVFGYLNTQDETTLLQNFLDAMDVIFYDAIGYDDQQDIFALISTSTREATPLFVDDPNSSA